MLKSVISAVTVVAASMLTMLSCDDSTTKGPTGSGGMGASPGVDYVYPLGPYAEWQYTAFISYTDIVPESLASLYEQEYSYHTAVIDQGIDTLEENGMPAHRLAEYYWGEASPDVSDTVFAWFNNEPDGLVNYAYAGGSVGLSIPRKPVHGPTAWWLDPITVLRPPHGTAVNANSTGPYIFDPVLSLEYPLKKGNTWSLQPISSGIWITKRVTGRELLEHDGHTDNCWVVEWTYHGGDDSAMTNIHMTDWLNDEGLVKRRLVVTDVPLVRYDSPEVIAHGTVTQEVTLVSVIRTVPFFPGGFDIIGR